MEVFYNFSMPGYKEISEYGPKWWTEFKEMDAVYMFEGWLLDVVAKKMEQEVKNLFPSTADENTIAMVFEPILGIEPEPTDTLEERRNTVAAYWYGPGKLSKTVIQSIIKAYTGCESELWWENSELQIRIYCDEESQFFQRKIHNIISKRYPVHLSFIFHNMLCVFRLDEHIVCNRIRYRSVLSWWEGFLDGSFILDGSRKLDTRYPTKIYIKNRFLVANKESFKTKQCISLPDVINTEKADIRGIQRVIMGWRDGNKILDGSYLLDGTFPLDSGEPPYLQTIRVHTHIEHEEKFNVAMVVPSLAAKLDGQRRLDGSVKLNSGREVL